ncbi:MAG: hypothetical protein H6835_15985 [Planctomycetes bacterium]|nr:hypothetical protein [Planctomycetota bacterium]
MNDDTRRLLPLHFLTAAVAMAAPALTQVWQQAVPATQPAARSSAAIGTDLVGGRVLLFGGAAGTSYLGDTWAYDGTDWSPIVGAAPPARAGAAAAFDASRGALVLYGGINGVSTSSYLAGTWEFANGAWSQRPNGGLPPRRFGHAMAYDAARGRVVMFGGRTYAGTIFLQDTWEWDGTSWTPFTPAHRPSNRMGHAMAFDANLGEVVLFGGLQLGGPFQADTWSWNGLDWTLRSPAASPSPRADHAMAADVERAVVVLHGGYDGADLGDTWQWDGAVWVQVATPVQPGTRALAAISCGPAGRHVVLFGGEGAVGPVSGTWRFGQLAQVDSFGVGCGTPPLLLEPANGSLPVLGQGFACELAEVPAGGLPFLSFGFSASAAGGAPLPLDLSWLGMTGCWLYHDPVLLGWSLVPSGASWASSLPLAGGSALAGVRLYAQAYALAPGSNALGLLTSNALTLTLGMP